MPKPLENLVKKREKHIFLHIFIQISLIFLIHVPNLKVFVDVQRED
jgi:hypothetical protein